MIEPSSLNPCHRNRVRFSNAQQPSDKPLSELFDDMDTPSPHDSNSSSSASPTNQVLVLDFEHDRTLKSEIAIEPKGKTEYKIHGVNVLNRQSINGFKAIEKIRRRRQSHALSERKRTTTMNGLITELIEVIPDISELDQRPAKSEILRMAVEYVKKLQVENKSLKSVLALKHGSQTLTPPPMQNLNQPRASLSPQPDIVFSPLSLSSPPTASPELYASIIDPLAANSFLPSTAPSAGASPTSHGYENGARLYSPSRPYNYPLDLSQEDFTTGQSPAPPYSPAGVQFTGDGKSWYYIPNR